MGVARALRRRLLKVEASPSAKAWRLPTDYVAMHESASGTQLPTSAMQPGLSVVGGRADLKVAIRANLAHVPVI